MTIITLIILAGVTINLALGENGLFIEAEQTKKYLSNSIESDETQINHVLSEIDNIIENMEPKKIEEITREEMFDKTTEIKDDEGNSVWIPKDFGIDEDSATNQDEGIVITDEIGNEFVWVPVTDPTTMFETVKEPVTLSDGVTKTNKYSKLRVREKDKNDNISDNPGTINNREPDVLSIGDNNINYITELGYDNITDMAKDLVEEYNDMAKSVEKYHGFYVGRYELTGKKEKPTVKAGWVLNASEASANKWYGLKKACQDVIKDNTDVKSTMIYGCQWDEIMEWLIKTKFKGDRSKVDEDSTSWGNYKDSSYPANVEGYGKAQETGHSEYWSANKIYDLAGNYYDLTQEANNNDKRLNRGDGYNGLGLKYSASSRYGYSVNEAIGPLTARVTLIISDSVS